MSGPRILIVGAAGQLGGELKRRFLGKSELLCTDRRTLDLTHPDRIREVVRQSRPDVILNAAAYTAVDRAESEAALAFKINAEAPGVLAEEALQSGALLVHYSTDYVFDGSKIGPWVESDPTNPLNAYGVGKLAGEEAIQKVGGRYLIFRTSWVYGPQGHNFLLTVLRLGRERDSLKIVNDQFGAPTSSIALADATQTILGRVLPGQCAPLDQITGMYHMSCSGSTTWYGFAEAAFVRAAHLMGGRRPHLIPIPSSEYPTPAKRPRNSVLSNCKLQQQLGVQLPAWQNALDRVLAELGSGFVPKSTKEAA